MRRGAEERPARGAAPKSVRTERKRAPSRGPSPAPRRLTVEEVSEIPPPPSRPLPSNLPNYRSVAEFDDARAPWSRETFKPKDEDKVEHIVSMVARLRWYTFCHKYTPQLLTGWHPGLACYNEFQIYELDKVFPVWYRGRGHARSDDVQAQRQANRAARRLSMSARASSTVSVPARPRTRFVHPLDVYLGDNANLLQETSDPMYPIVNNDAGVPQPILLGAVQARDWFLNTRIGGEWGDLIKASQERREDGTPQLQLFKKSPSDLANALKAANAVGIPGHKTWREEMSAVFTDQPDEMFSNPDHCPEPPRAHPSASTTVPLCVLRDVQSQVEHMGSDWCGPRTGRLCGNFASKCKYGRLCRNIHTVSHRLLCTRVRQMLAGMKDKDGRPITCSDDCPLVAYGGHWPAFGEINELFVPPATQPETIMALRWVDHAANLHSGSMGCVGGFWTPSGFMLGDGQKLNWLAGDPDCLLSPVLCGTGRTSGRHWGHSRKHQGPGYGTIVRRLPRHVFFGRNGLLREEYRFAKPVDTTVPPDFFGNRAVLATPAEWRNYIKSCNSAAFPLANALNSGQLIPLVADEELVERTAVLTKPGMPGTGTFQHVSVTKQAGYKLPGE